MLKTKLKKMRPQADPNSDRSECGSVLPMTDGNPGGSPPRPGLRHQSAPAQSVWGCGGSGCGVILGCWVEFIGTWGTGGLVDIINVFIIQEVRTHSSHISHTLSSTTGNSYDLILVPHSSQGNSFFFLTTVAHRGVWGPPRTCLPLTSLTRQ